ncbi:hypothetical protein QL285_058296 [Trifolium repens]|nr:hypothetical protein QL285_058296 [Trifolium repens]
MSCNSTITAMLIYANFGNGDVFFIGRKLADLVKRSTIIHGDTVPLPSWDTDDRNFYGIFSIIISSKMTKVQDAKRQEKAQKVKKMSIPSQHDNFHRATMEAACSPRKQKNKI